jgi:RES domain-containing protein
VIYSAELLDALSPLQPTKWEGLVYRHMFGLNPPEKENTDGARWNPPDVAAIYTSLEQQTAIAEADYQINAQPFRPKAERKIHRIRVRLASVLDLNDWTILQKLEVDKESFGSPEPPRCKEVGGAIALLGHDGLLAPSARIDGINLVVFPANLTAVYEFTPIDFVVIP